MATLRRWSLTLTTAAITAAVLLVGGILLFAQQGTIDMHALTRGPRTPRATAPPPTQSRVTPQAGPEGVPLVSGAALGPARSPAPGRSSGGIPCGSREQLVYHVHARLTIFINGKPRAVPLGVGIGGPRQVDHTASGAFVAGGRCFSFLHTHAADGVIHIEAPGKVVFKLGQFFDVWRQRLDSRHLGSARGRVTAYVDGHRFKGDPRAIPLHKHTQIELELGHPRVRPATIQFPTNL